MLHITTYKKDARSRYIKIDAKFKVGGALCFFFGKDCHKIRTLAPARPWPSLHIHYKNFNRGLHGQGCVLHNVKIHIYVYPMIPDGYISQGGENDMN